MKKIAIFGAGGFGREVACLINKINEVEPQWEQWDFIGFFDDGKEIGSQNEYGKILGGAKELNEWQDELAVVIAIASPKIVEMIVSKITSPKISFPNLIAPDVIYLDQTNYKIGKGNIIGFGCSISCNVSIEDFNIFNGAVSVGHDSVIGSYNSLMPSVKVSGNVNIGNKNFFGVNSVILQGVKIGTNTKVAASALILRNTTDGNTYVGNPALKL